MKITDYISHNCSKDVKGEDVEEMSVVLKLKDGDTITVIITSFLSFDIEVDTEPTVSSGNPPGSQ